MGSVPEDWETTDVVICGCGPTGAALSGYLGRLSVKNVVLEREPAITTDPRGIALDEDGIRIVQGLGLYDHLFTEVAIPIDQMRFVGGVGTDLQAKPFMVMDYGTTEGGTGHVGMICHKQPVLEKCLRQAMSSTPYSDLRSNSKVTEISEDNDWVYCRYEDASGATRKLKSKFFVGADGKRGFTRKHYLEPRGITLDTIPGASYEEVWVALNWHITLPTPQTHPDFPLWRKGYSPEDVYDAFFPRNFRFLANPNRPAVCGRFGLVSDRLWRFEYVVLEGEDGGEMASEHMMKKVVCPYLKHPGSRYGLSRDVEFPYDCVHVLRCRPFTFLARSCNKWAQDRIVLCGDAAHVFPPFGGQGIASGFRDAISLAWRLSVACRFRQTDYGRIEPLLQAWYRERMQQLSRSLATTVENGNNVTTRNPFKIFMRDWYLWLISFSPALKHSLHLGGRREGLVHYQHESNFPFLPELGGGGYLPQVYCRELRSAEKNEDEPEVRFTDDVIWSHSKKGLLRLCVFLASADEIMPALDTIKTLLGRAEGPSFMKPENATILIQDVSTILPQHVLSSVSGWDVHRLASGEEFAQSRLCSGRREPEGYDHTLLGREVKHKRYLILRPDRFVFAACETLDELEAAVQHAHDMLGSASTSTKSPSR